MIQSRIAQCGFSSYPTTSINTGRVKGVASQPQKLATSLGTTVVFIVSSFKWGKVHEPLPRHQHSRPTTTNHRYHHADPGWHRGTNRGLDGTGPPRCTTSMPSCCTKVLRSHWAMRWHQYLAWFLRIPDLAHGLQFRLSTTPLQPLAPWHKKEYLATGHWTSKSGISKSCCSVCAPHAK